MDIIRTKAKGGTSPARSTTEVTTTMVISITNPPYGTLFRQIAKGESKEESIHPSIGRSLDASSSTALGSVVLVIYCAKL
jgi:23S rRNA G2445 N2-methylase RlmL